MFLLLSDMVSYVKTLAVLWRTLGVRTKRGSCSMHRVFHTGFLAQSLYGGNLLSIGGRAISDLP